MVKLKWSIDLPDWQTDMHNPDFALGCSRWLRDERRITVKKTPEDGQKFSLKEALMYKGPALQNILPIPTRSPPKLNLNKWKACIIHDQTGIKMVDGRGDGYA